MAIAHLIFGYLGAGKTTFAKVLAPTVGGVLLSQDEFYLRLFTDGLPTQHLDADADQRLAAVLDDLWPEILRGGVDVVLDFGFWQRSRRDVARSKAVQVGGAAQLYRVSCDDQTARGRLRVRQESPGYSFEIPDGAYDELRTKFEPLGPDEAFELIDTTPSGGMTRMRRRSGPGRHQSPES